jgi:hypothetical protein
VNDTTAAWFPFRCTRATSAGAVEVTALLERLVDALRSSTFCADGHVRPWVRAGEKMVLARTPLSRWLCLSARR